MLEKPNFNPVDAFGALLGKGRGFQRSRGEQKRCRKEILVQKEGCTKGA